MKQIQHFLLLLGASLLLSACPPPAPPESLHTHSLPKAPAPKHTTTYVNQGLTQKQLDQITANQKALEARLQKIQNDTKPSKYDLVPVAPRQTTSPESEHFYPETR